MIKNFLLLTLILATTKVNAETMSLNMTNLESGKIVGMILIEENQYGVVFTPKLTGLVPGLHGFHIHQNPSCKSVEKNGKTILGGAAGGHFDPLNTGKHGFPWSNNNHLGDLPAMYVDMDKNAMHPVLATRIKLSDLSGRALMIHAGSENHSDHPKALGGGGARLLCGVFK